MELAGSCPICDASVMPEEDIEESEILTCPDCHSMLVVDHVDSDSFDLTQAPEIEEDWGE